MHVGVPREVHPGERRVAATPDTVDRLQKLGFDVLVESGAGEGANIPDPLYEEAGATIVPDAKALWSQADIVMKIRAPEALPDGTHEADLLSEGGTLVSLIQPGINTELVERLAAKKPTVIGLDCVPRISRAQTMDVLSSMANIAGYRAVLEAAHEFDRFFGAQITAAGRAPAAKVLVIGAGVAGLAAVATAKEMGAEVYAFDTRLAVKEQVESLGGRFLELEFEESGEGGGGYAKVMSKEFIEAEMALFREMAPTTDVIITTANIPGKKAPTLVPEDVVALMKPGSVIIDLAAENGGNCPLTKPGEVIVHDGVTIVGHTDLTSRMPTHASQFFGNNVAKLLGEYGGAEEWNVDLDNQVIRGATILHDGEMLWPPPRLEPTPVVRSDAPSVPVVLDDPAAEAAKAQTLRTAALVVTALLLAAVGLFAPTDFIKHVTVFVLACFVGWQVIWNVHPSLHTPLMSATNAISGIIVVGGLLQAGALSLTVASVLGAVAVLVATINIAGGFLVTQRMLAMFRK